MEEAGPGYGYMLYRTYVTGFDNVMKVKAIQTSDRVHFYLNGVFQGVQYQEEIGTEIEMEFGRENVLELLVENMGRVNYAEGLVGHFRDRLDGTVHRGEHRVVSGFHLGGGGSGSGGCRHVTASESTSEQYTF